MKAKKLLNKKSSNLILSVVALVEVLLIAVVSTFAWVETVSTIEISGSGSIDTYTYTEASIGSGSGYDNTPINLSQYIRESGDFHFSLASSADGKEFYFPKVASMNSSASAFRKGNINDKNVNYISFSLKVKSLGEERDFVFADIPTIKIGDTKINDNSVRIAISDEETTGIYSFSEVSNGTVAGVSGNTNINAFSVYSKAYFETNKKSLFTVPKDGEKTITISIWLQYDESKIEQYLGQQVSINGLKIVPVVSTDATVIVSGDSTMGSVTAQFGSESGENITVPENSTVKIKATPKEGYRFVAWHNGTSASDAKIDGAGAEYEFTAEAKETYNYYAEFAKIVYITINFVDGTSEQWIHNNGAKIYLEADSSRHEMTKVGNIWSVSVPSTVTNVSFYRMDPNNLNNSWNYWTNTGTRGSNNTYTATDNNKGSWSSTRRIYFTNNWNWDTVYCYVWNSTSKVNNANWPGAQMQFYKTNSNNEDIYFIDVLTNKGYDKIVFNNSSGAQTADADLGSKNAYWISGSNGDKGTVTAYDYTG